MTALSPILNRELVAYLRRRRAFVALLVFLLLLCFVAGIMWKTALALGAINQRDWASRTLFSAIALSQLVLFPLYVIVLSCAKITSERERRTFDLLMTSPVSTSHIIAAKYFSSLAVIVLVTISSAPAVALCFFLGGVGWDEFTIAYLLTFMAVLAYGMVGLACSSFFRKTHSAFFASTVIALFLCFGVPVLAAAASEIVVITTDEKSMMLAAVASPFSCYFLVHSGSLAVRSAARGAAWEIVLYHALFQACLLAVAACVAWRFGVRPYAQRDARAVPRRKAAKTALKARRVFGWRGLVKSRTRWRPVRDGANPVFVRERREFVFNMLRVGRVLLVVGLIVVVIIGLVIMMSFGSRYSFDDMLGMAALVTVAMGLIAPMLGARTVASEKDSGTLHLLVACPLRARTIIAGKALTAVGKVLLLALCVTFLLMLAMMKMVARPWQSHSVVIGWLRILPPLFAILTMLSMVGVLFSTVCRSTASAMVWSYGVLAGLCVGTPILHGLLFVRTDMQTVGSFILPILSPVMYFVPEDTLNYFHENDQWGTIFHYVFLVGVLAAGLYFAALRIFAEKYCYPVGVKLHGKTTCT